LPGTRSMARQSDQSVTHLFTNFGTHAY
jgi:hypothetical protein